MHSGRTQWCAGRETSRHDLLRVRAVRRDLFLLLGGESFGASPFSRFALWTCSRISSTTSGLASVEMSPTSVKLEIPAITRRMIFPERVLGMSGTTHTFLGRAIAPMSLTICWETFFGDIARLLTGLDRHIHLDDLAAGLVDHRHGGGLGDLLDLDRGRLELLGPEPVARDVDHVVDAARGSGSSRRRPPRRRRRT